MTIARDDETKAPVGGCCAPRPLTRLGRAPAIPTDEDLVRSEVSIAYAQAVTREKGGGGSCCCAPVGTPEALQAGYDPAELAALPRDAVENSFGCGNPVALAGLKDGDVVLDLGSGAGIDILLAGRKVGVRGRVIGVDMTDEMLVRARENIARAGLPNVEVRKGIIEALPVEDGSVDWVISNCVINLSPNKPKVFSEIARVLKAGGRLSVSDIVAEELPSWVREHSTLYCACVAGAISEAKYLDGLRAAGLAEVAVADRFVYEAEQLRAILLSDDLVGAGDRDEALVERASRELAGKVWSARFVARKA